MKRKIYRSLIVAVALWTPFAMNIETANALLTIPELTEQSIYYYAPGECAPSGVAPSGTLDETTEDGFKINGNNSNKRMILVHTTEGDTADAAISALMSRGYAYHTLIEQSGTEIRLVPDEAIVSGAMSANTDSVHVSLVGKAGDGSHFDPESPQLQTLAKRIGEWAKKFNIPLEKVSGPGILNGGTTKGVAGHIDVANADPTSYAGNGRTDPGQNFPWGPVLANARASQGASAIGDNQGRTTDAQSVSSTSNSSSADKCCPANPSGGSVKAPGDGGGCGDKTGGSEANKNQVWTYFMGKFSQAGYSTEEAERATAGIMGNWEQESGFNPDRHNAPSPGSGCSGAGAPVTGNAIGMGIAQWCGDRQTKLVTFAGGEDPSCLGIQLEYAWSEMEDKKLVQAMRGVDPAKAASIFNLGGNGAEGFEIGHDDQGRQDKALVQYADFTGKDPGSLDARSASSSSCPGSSPGSAGSGSVADAAKAAGDKGGCYDTGGGHDTLQDLEQRISNNFSQGFGVDCSGFVRAMLFVGTGKDPGSFTTMDLMTVPDGFTEVTDRCQAQPGDVTVTNSHTEIITEVVRDGSTCTFKTVGAHTTGCAPENGIYPAEFQGDKVIRYNPGAVSV